MTSELRVDNPSDELINNPEHTYHYWRYSLHLDLEDLRDNEGLTSFYQDFINETRRAKTIEE